MTYCTIDGCEKPHLARGWCSMHYRRWRNHGNPQTVIIQKQQHRQSRTRLYTVWANIRQRTSNPRYKQYKDYGGRGIKMCSGWWNSFPTFVEDMGERPTVEHSIDRVDNEKGYTCGKCDECVARGWNCNVRWSTRVQQVVNRRRPKGSSGYKGVRQQNGRYTARVTHKSQEIYLGRYDTPEEAAKAYNDKMLELHGNIAVLNLLPISTTK